MSNEANSELSSSAVPSESPANGALQEPLSSQEAANELSPHGGDTTTMRFVSPEITTLTARWGSILDGTVRRLAFTIPGWREPVVVPCAGELVVGRSSREGPPPDFDLGRYAAYVHGVSRHHARIWVDGDTLKLVDLESTNGTYLNGVRLPKLQPRILRDGDDVTFGRLTVRINLT